MSIRKITVVLGTLIVVTLGYVGFKDAVRTHNTLQGQKNTIDNLNKDYENLDKKLDKTEESKQKSQKEVEKLKKEKKKLEDQRNKLQRDLQAKNEAKARLASASTSVIDTALGSQVASASVDCVGAAKAAGITNPIGLDLIGRESGCDPCSYNPGQSDCGYTGDSACGIPQANPCSKLRAACAPWTDVQCQLRWMQNYVMGRYHSWENAKAHHDALGWY